MFTASPAALRLIQSSEGLKLTPYLDTSHIYTVGWGHALTTPDGKNIATNVFGEKVALRLAQEFMQRTFGVWTISREQADKRLSDDLQPTVAALSKRIASDTTQSQFDALVSLTFNLGIGHFDTTSVKRFHNENKRAVGTISLGVLAQRSKQHDVPVNMAEAFASWSNSGGHWTLGLYRRRVAEALVYSGWEADAAIKQAWSFNG